ncbi:hypothetical protein MMC17_000033 [Xylographa soralifera]|nr:hypothetical protein [Xylographa soralifera]
MATSTSTDGWLPPHLRIIQSQSRSISEANSTSPTELVSTNFQAFDSFQNLPLGLGDGCITLTKKSSNASRLPPTSLAGYQPTSLKEDNSPPHPCSIIEQKSRPQIQSVTAQQWKSSLNAHLEKYRSRNVPQGPPQKHLSEDVPKASSEQLPLSYIPPHLRALSSTSASVFNVQVETLSTSSCAQQEKEVQPNTVSNSTDSSAVPSLARPFQVSPVPKQYSTYNTTSTNTQGLSVSNNTESYLEASSTELDLLPAHLRVLQPTPTPAPSRLTRAHLAAFDRMTVTTNFSIASASSETTTQMTRKPRIDKGKGREVQLPLPAPPPALPPTKIRTGDAATWTKKADMPELMKMSKDYPCPYEDCRLGFDTLKALRRHKVEKHDYCKKCDKDFKDAQDHLDHKIESSEHITCPVCGEDFRSNGGRDVHIRTMHPNPQDLSCPGCGAKFVRAGSLIDHIEKNKCMRISVDQFERYRASHAIKNAQLTSLGIDEDEETLFTVVPDAESVGGVDLVTENGEDEDELGSLTIATNEVAIQESEHGSRTTMASVLASQADANGCPSIRRMSISLQSEEFPALGGASERKTAGALASTQAGPKIKIPAWSTPGSTSHKVIVETAKHNPRNTKQNIPTGTTRYSHPVLTDMTTGSVQTKSGLTFSNGEPVEAIDPTSPNYNPDAFKTVLGTWKCPYPRCGKSFPTRQGFTGHQSSQAHKGVDHRCPECLRIYQDATALTQHMEASGSRCRIKLSKDYDKIMGMVSGGIIRVDGQHVDGTVRYDAGEPEW